MNGENQAKVGIPPDRPKIPSIRTFSSDTAEYIQKKNVSMVDIVAEQSKKGQVKQPEYKNDLNFGILSAVLVLFLLVLVGAGGFWYYKNHNQANQPENQNLFFKPFILTEREEIVFVDKNDFLSQIHSVFNKDIQVGTMLNIVAAQKKGDLEQNIGTENFFQWAGIKYQSSLLDSFSGEMMFIKYSFSRNWPVLIIKVNFYDSAFSRMIKWENFMLKDLQPLLGLEFETLGNFEDVVIENRDTRVIKETDGRDILIYSFINKDYLVITTSREALMEVFRRFSSPQYLNQ